MFVNDREKYAKWYESNKLVHNMVVRHQRGTGVAMRFDWACPVYHSAHLPGGAMSIDTDPECTVLHDAISGLHGMMTGVSKVPHDPSNPVFSLFPNPSGQGWACYVSDAAIATRMANASTPAHLWQYDLIVKTGPLFRLRAPAIPTPEAHLVRVDTVTPLVIRATRRNTNERTYTDIKASNVVSTLGAWTPRRILADGFGSNLAIEMLGKEMKTVVQPIGGHREPVVSVIGSMWLKVNAPTLWLLRVAERIGLGGRTAFGFGRIKLEEQCSQPS